MRIIRNCQLGGQGWVRVESRVFIHDLHNFWRFPSHISVCFGSARLVRLERDKLCSLMLVMLYARLLQCVCRILRNRQSMSVCLFVCLDAFVCFRSIYRRMVLFVTVWAFRGWLREGDAIKLMAVESFLAGILCFCFELCCLTNVISSKCTLFANAVYFKRKHCCFRFTNWAFAYNMILYSTSVTILRKPMAPIKSAFRAHCLFPPFPKSQTTRRRFRENNNSQKQTTPTRVRRVLDTFRHS